MNKYNSLFLTFSALAAATVLTGCGEDSPKVTQLPFKTEQDGKWGLISTDGKVILENEFRNVPTYVTDDRFFVQNQDGFWEMYTASEKPERIGGELRYASVFSDGVAMVTPRDQPISIIDTKGNVKMELVEFEGKKVSWAGPFVRSTAIVGCDTVQGVVNTSGKTVVKPEYANINQLVNGLLIADSHEYVSTHLEYDTIKPKGTEKILDHKGNEKYVLDGSKYWNIVSEAVTDKYITVRKRNLEMKTVGSGKDSYTYPEVTWTYSVIDYKGETVLKPSKDIYSVLGIRGDMYSFANEDLLCGVKTFDGKEIVKAEYNGINFIGTDMIAAMKNGDESTDWNPIVTIFDTEGKRVTNQPVRGVSGIDKYLPLAGNNVFVEVENGEWTVLDAKGQKLDNLPKLYSVLPYSGGDERMYTDKVNFESLIKGLELTPTSVGEFTMRMGPRAAIEAQQRSWSSGLNMEFEKPTPSSYSYLSSIWFNSEVDGLNCSGKVQFPQTLSKQTYSEKKVIDYTYGNYYWYHMEKVPKGYVFNNITPSYLELEFASYTFYGKLRPLYKALVNYCKSWGTVEESNPGATLMRLKDGNQLLIALTESNVIMRWGKLPSDDKWIGQYSSNAEKLQSSYTGNEYYKYMFTCPVVDEEGDI
ncbi:MAG: WG repeat-containing protein [Muribaculaceae bacterium]|nr:WG repeat-containing protein [Muribaculaceae bacterium]